MASLSEIAKWLLVGILSGLSLVHWYWAMGGRLGLAAALPRMGPGQALTEPGLRGASLGVAFALAVGATGIATPFDPWLKAQSLRALALICVLRCVGDFRYFGVGRRVADSPFAYWDRYLYTPLCLLMAALAVIASIG